MYQNSVSYNGAFITIDRKSLEEGPGFADFLPFPDDLYFYAGRVALNWSQVESRIDWLLAGLLRGNGTPEPPGLKSFSAKRRRLLLLAECRKAFAAHPDVIAGVERLCHDAANIFWMRNLLIHGRLLFKAGTESAIHATGIHNGTELAIEFTVELMAGLAQDMEHLAASFRVLAISPGSVFPELSSPDKGALQSFLAKNLQGRPMERPREPVPIRPKS